MPFLSNSPYVRILGFKERATPWYRAGGAPQPVAAYQAKGAGSLADSYVNLASPGVYNLVPSGTPGWDTASGWSFNATQYLATGIVAAADYTIMARFTKAMGATGAPIGQVGAGDSRHWLQFIAGGKYYGYGSFFSSGQGDSTGGVMAMAGPSGYFNGVNLPGGSGGVWSGAGVAYHIGARNNNGVTQNYYTGNIQAVAIYNTVLTAQQVAAVTSAMQAL